MGKGVLTPSTIAGFAVITSLLIIIIALWIQSKRAKDPAWSDSNTSRTIQNVTVAALSCYSLSVFFSWVLFIEILSIGYDLDKSEPIQTLTMVLFILPFVVALFLTIFLWIKRLECAFQTTDFAFTASFLKTVHVIFYVVCIIGSILIIVWIASKIIINDFLQLLRKALGAVFVLILLVEIVIILHAYLGKLSQLKKRCKMVVQSFDRRVAEIMTKLVALQIKLSILLMTMIVGTFVCIGLGIVIEGYASYIPIACIAFLGFVCIYCSIPGHREVYSGMCAMCVACCMRCVSSYDELMVLHVMVDSGLEVKSTTDGATVDTAMPSLPPMPTPTPINK